MGLIILLEGCHPPKKTKQSHSLSLFSQNVMTINYRILVGHPLNSLQKQALQVIIDQTFIEIDAIYNKWNPLSEISQLNRLPAYQTRKLSPQLFEFMQRIEQLVQLTDGRFDPTVEPLEQVWIENLRQGRVPSADQLANIKPCIGWDKIHYTNGLFYKDDGRSKIDLGGIAKGLCVDLLIERINQAGFSNLFVEWGGEIRVSGQHPDQRPWSIFISCLGDPQPQNALAYLNLYDQAIATSGDYFQSWTIILSNEEEKIYTHIFNPKTLAPLLVKPGSVASASLIANDCTTADALAKVLMLFESVNEAQQWIEEVNKQIPDLNYWIAVR